MPKRRNLKTTLKKNYQTPSLSSTTEAKPNTAESVTDKINRLRIEHLRASEKPLRQQVLNNKYKDKSTSSSRIAGPPPPPSWLVNNVTTPNKKRSKHHKSDDIDTLCKQCAAQIAKAIPSYLSAIPDLPVRTRQLILRYTRDLDDSYLSAFVSFDYGELQLIESKVSFNRFLKYFWRLDPVQEEDDTLLDDWEDQIDDDEEGDDGIFKYIYDPQIESEDDHKENVDIKDERTFHIQHIIMSIHQTYGSGNKKKAILDQPFMLYTPLSMKLVSLNISFPKKAFPNITFAHLLISTLPNLRQLGTASVFNSVIDGPRAISLISSGLVKLEEWDLGYHDWLTADLLLGKLIHWNTDLRKLKRLIVGGIEDPEQLALDFKNAGHKFNVVF